MWRRYLRSAQRHKGLDGRVVVNLSVDANDKTSLTEADSGEAVSKLRVCGNSISELLDLHTGDIVRHKGISGMWKVRER